MSNLSFIEKLRDGVKVEWKTLGELCVIGDGLHGTPKYDDSGEYFFINGNNLDNGQIVFNDKTKKVNDSMFKKYGIDFTVENTVFLSINGTIGSVSFYGNEKIVLGKSVAFFNIKSADLYSRYLFYFLQTDFSKKYFEAQKTGSTIKNLGLKALRLFEIPLPPLDEQVRIVTILEKFDALTSSISEGLPREIKLRQQQYEYYRDQLLSFREKLPGGVDVEWKALGDDDFVEVANSGRKPVKASLRVAGKTAYYGANNIQDYVDGHTHDGEYVLIAEDGSASLENYSIQYVSGKFWANNHVHVIRGKSGLNTRFLYHYLCIVNFISFLTGGGRAKLTKGKMVGIQIPIPCPENPKKSLEIQAEIVRILDTFTELPAGLTAELTAELTARKKQYNYYRDQLLSFKEGEVEWKTLGEVSDIYDSLHQTPQYAESGLSMIRVTDIKGGYVNLEKTLRVNKEIFAQFTKKYLPEKNDLVMSRVGSYGNVGIVPVDDSACMGQNTVVIHPIINSKYLFHILVSNIGQNFIERNVGGGNQKTLSLKSIKAIPIPLVSEKEQERIATTLDKFDALTNSITEGLPREIALRQQQYEYYRDQLLSFAKPDGVKVEWKTLGDITEIKTGQKPSEIFESATDFDYINAGTSRSGYSAGSNCEGDTVTTPSRGQGGIGYVGYQKKSFWLGPLCYKMKSTNQKLLVNKYLFYFLQSKRELLLGLKKEGGVPAINKSDLAKLEIPIPCPENPKKSLEIVRILDTFTEPTAELTAELTTRKKQYNYYRDQLLSFEEGEVEWKALGEVAHFANGKGHEKDISEDGKYIVVNSKFISTDGKVAKYSNSQICPLFKDDVLLVMSDLPNGKALSKAFIVDADEKYTLNQRIGGITVKNKEELLPKFLHYFLNRTPQLLKHNNGVDQTNLRKGQILEVKIPIISPAEQARIVAILDKFDALTSSITEGLPREIALRQQRYEYYHNQLLSFREKLPGGVKVEWKALGETVKLQRGKRLVKSQLQEAGSYAVYQNCMTPLGYYHESNVKSDTTFIISAGAAGEIGYSDVDFWAADDVYFFITPNHIKNKFLYYFLLTQQNKILAQVRRASIPRLPKTVLEKLQIPMPPLAEQARIVAILDKFDALTNSITEGLPREIALRQQQYEYYRDQLLSFREKRPGGVKVEWLPLWEVTTWDKKFNAVDNFKQPEIIKYQYLLSKEIKALIAEAGTVKLLTTNLSSLYTTEKLAGEVVGQGEIVAIPGGGNPVVQFYKGKFLTSDNRIATSNDINFLNNKYLYYFLLNNLELISSFYRGSGIKHPSMAAVLDIEIPIPPIHTQAEIVRILDKFDALTSSITEGLPREIALRQQQYEYYRDLLLSFPKPDAEVAA